MGKSSFFRMGSGDTAAPEPHWPSSCPSRPFSKIPLQLLEHFRHWKGSKVCLDPPLPQVSISISSRLFPSHLSSVLPRGAASALGRAHTGHDHTGTFPRKSLPALSHFQLCSDQSWLDPLPSCSQTPPLTFALSSPLSWGCRQDRDCLCSLGPQGVQKS